MESGINHHSHRTDPLCPASCPDGDRMFPPEKSGQIKSLANVQPDCQHCVTRPGDRTLPVGHGPAWAIGAAGAVGETGRMDRRGFLLAASALLAAGCARVPPPAVAGRRLATPARLGPLLIGTEDSPLDCPDGAVAGARPCCEGTDRSARSCSATPGRPRSVRGSLRRSRPSREPCGRASEVAGTHRPRPTWPVRWRPWCHRRSACSPLAGVDGSLMWVVAESTATAGHHDAGSDRRPGRRGKVAAVPEFAVSRADGLPGLKTVYGASFTVAKTESPRERAAALTTGRAAIAAFRRSEYIGTGLSRARRHQQDRAHRPGRHPREQQAGRRGARRRCLRWRRSRPKLTTDPLLAFQAKVAGGASARRRP